MSPIHDPPRALVVLLLTCPECNGSEEIETERDGLCVCHVCHDGYQGVALPLMDVLNAMHNRHKVNGEAEGMAKLYQLAQRKPPRHPIIYNASDTSTRFRIPLSRPVIQERSAPDNP